VHLEKQYGPITSTDDGITISLNPVLLNAQLSIRINRGTDSNVTDTSDLHQKKQYGPITSTDDGITTSLNPVS
jgi:hypothetical protein